MNKERRKEITTLVERINNLKDEINDIKDKVDFVKRGEQKYVDNFPENLQGSEKYAIAEDACEALEGVLDSLEEAIEGLESAAE